MKKLLLPLLGMLVTLLGCKLPDNMMTEKKKEAKLVYVYSHRNDMMMVNGEVPPATVKSDTTVVKAGDKFHQFDVKKVTDNEVKLESSFFSYYTGASNKPEKEFTVVRGKKLKLSEADITDVTINIEIYFLEE
ncbi:MAG: hypothetical protein KBT15_11130 [Bacteroidales bacterium]|nr:hypothetical protein [Candidatus Minthousia equi]